MTVFVDPDGRPDSVDEPARTFACYLGGPIDGLGEAESRSWARASRYRADRDTLLALLVSSGFAVYAPHLAWTGADQRRAPHDAVSVSNSAALAAVDCVVAMLPDGVPTVGTYAEVLSAATAGTPVVVIDRRPLTSDHICDPPLPPGVVTVDGLDQAIKTVEAWRDSGVLGSAVGDRVPTGAGPLADSTVELPFTLNPGVDSWALPVRHYPDDAALDLWVTNSVTIEPGRFADIPAGCRVQLPTGSFGMIVGRSSAVRKRGILVVTGVIDVGYRGDLFVGCYNVGEHTQTIEVGERLGQLIILPNLTQQYVPQRVAELSDSQRGSAGFGSTGR